MKLGIMQPYFFPYLGYFQLIHAVDKFVFYDDVNFIKNGWINRNRILFAGEPRYFTVPLDGASSFRPICETRFQTPGDRWKRKMLSLFEQNYGKAPHFESGMRVLREVLALETARIGELARESIYAVMRVCDLSADMAPTSSVYANSQLSGAARIIDICQREGASHYVNAPGGRALYGAGAFAAQGICLEFIEPELTPYPQQDATGFRAGLSILDVIMNCGALGAADLIKRGRVVAATL